MTGKYALEKKLQHLLGFDEVLDVLDHLLSMLDPADVEEYLSSLLGDNTTEVKEFVSQINSYKLNGGKEDIFIVDDTKTNSLTSKPSLEANIRKSSGDLEKISVVIPKAEVKLNVNNTPIKIPQTKAKLKPKSKTGIAVAKVGSAKSLNTKKEQKQTNKASSASSTASTTPKPVMPQKGPPPPACGCFGTLHQCLTNCLHCGRIACEKEGYGYCCFCHNLIEDPSIQGIQDDAATRHKQRLLKFDRENVRRMEVIDKDIPNDNNAISVWLNEEERQIAEQLENKRRDAMHTRANMTLQLGDF